MLQLGKYALLIIHPLPFNPALIWFDLIGLKTQRLFQKVTRIEGVFSGTLSYIFNEFSTGAADGPSFSTVVRTARDKGYTVRPLSRSQSPTLT